MTIDKKRMTPAAASLHVRDWPWAFYPPRHALTPEEIAERKVMSDRAIAETGWMVDGGHRFAYKDALLEYRVSSTYASTRGTVKLHKGTWPSDHELIAMADNCDPATPIAQSDHFGGNVSPIKEGEDTRMVAVYTD